MSSKKPRENSVPFWLQIVLILLCGAIASVFIVAIAKRINKEQDNSRQKKHTVTFAYPDGTVIAKKTAKDGKGVVPPTFDSPGVFQGWSKPINSIVSDIEVHPLYYTVANENLFCFNSVYVKEGSEFEIELLLTGEVNISSAEITLDYDSAVMEFIELNNSENCLTSKNESGTLVLILENKDNFTEQTVISRIRFKALKKDVYSTEITLNANKVKVNSFGKMIPGTATTLNNKIFYLQEVG